MSKSVIGVRIFYHELVFICFVCGFYERKKCKEAEKEQLSFCPSLLLSHPAWAWESHPPQGGLALLLRKTTSSSGSLSEGAGLAVTWALLVDGLGPAPGAPPLAPCACPVCSAGATVPASPRLWLF